MPRRQSLPGPEGCQQIFLIFCDIFRPQLCALLEHNVGQVGGLEEDLATHHYERISTAVTCGDEDRWPVVDSSSSLPTHGMVQVPQRAVSGPGHVVRWQLRLRGPRRREGVRPGAGVGARYQIVG